MSRKQKKSLVSPQKAIASQSKGASSASLPAGSDGCWKFVGIGFLLAVITLVVFWPVLRCGFINYDDPEYITANPHVQNGLTWDGVVWAFRTGYASNWHPLTWISLMLDVQIFGPGAIGPHAVNLLLHVANTVLVFVVLKRFTGALWRSAFVAALFALHPLHVESVAWVSERKDLLSAFFALLTLAAYGRHAKQLEAAKPKPPFKLWFQTSLYYWLAWVCFALGLMSKPMLVTLPFILLLLDYWPLRRWGTLSFGEFFSGLAVLAWEKIPFFALSVISCVVTIIVQAKGGTVQSLANFSIGERIENAFVSYARYLGKTLYPENLAIYYPHPGHWPPMQVMFAVILVTGLSFGVLYFGPRIPFAVTGWFWFLGTLVPVIGLIQAGDQSMADRYTYLPLIGVFMILAWGMDALFACLRTPKLAMGVAAGIVIVLCATRTTDQLRYWQDSETIFRHAIAVTPQNYLAQNNLGDALLQKGSAGEAITCFQTALAIEPDCLVAEKNLANALAKIGRTDEAIEYYQKVLEIRPDYAEANNNLANLLKQQGQLDAAVLHYKKAIESLPDDAEIHHNFAGALLEQGHADEAIAQYKRALELDPNLIETRHDLGIVLAQNGRLDEAVVQFQKILAAQPNNAEAHNNIANAFFQKGRIDEAIAHYEMALEIHPDYAEVQDNLGRVAWLLATAPDASRRNGTKALSLAEQADKISGGKNPIIVGELAAAYAETGQFPKAVAAAERAVQLAGNLNDPSLVGVLQGQLKFYQAGFPFRDTGSKP